MVWKVSRQRKEIARLSVVLGKAMEQYRDLGLDGRIWTNLGMER